MFSFLYSGNCQLQVSFLVSMSDLKIIFVLICVKVLANENNYLFLLPFIITSGFSISKISFSILLLMSKIFISNFILITVDDLQLENLSIDGLRDALISKMVLGKYFLSLVINSLL